jgi:hypothetical protein
VTTLSYVRNPALWPRFRRRRTKLGHRGFADRELQTRRHSYLADVLFRLVNLWPNSRLDELLPWNWAARKGSPATRRLTSPQMSSHRSKGAEPQLTHSCASRHSTGSRRPSGARTPSNDAPYAASNPRHIATRSNASLRNSSAASRPKRPSHKQSVMRSSVSAAPTARSRLRCGHACWRFSWDRGSCAHYGRHQ